MIQLLADGHVVAARGAAGLYAEKGGGEGEAGSGLGTRRS